MSRIPAALTAAATIATAGMALNPVADAATIGTCSLVVPSQVRVVSPYQHYTASVTGGCRYYSSQLGAAWAGYTKAGMDNYLFFENKVTEDLDVYDFDTLGVMTWRPDGAAEEGNYNEFIQNTPTTELRVGSWSSLYASRSGSTVNIWGNASRYSTYYQKPISWQSTATVQYRAPGGSAWSNLTTVPVNGSYKYSYRTTATREYRVVIAGASTIWPSTTATLRK